jgi:putative sigma-54 modulation protein
MHIDIQARGFRLTEALREHAARRLRFALGGAGGRVRRVAVRVADENGPRGGVDKRCTLRVSLPGQPPVIVEQLDPDLYAAIDRAADRLGRSVARRLARGAHDRRHGALSRGAAAPGIPAG